MILALFFQLEIDPGLIFAQTQRNASRTIFHQKIPKGLARKPGACGSGEKRNSNRRREQIARQKCERGKFEFNKLLLPLSREHLGEQRERWMGNQGEASSQGWQKSIVSGRRLLRSEQIRGHCPHDCTFTKECTRQMISCTCFRYTLTASCDC